MSFCLFAALSETRQSEQAETELARNATPGVKHTHTGKEVRWRKRATTVYIDSSVDKLGPNARQAIRAAFGAWMSSTSHLPKLAFEEASGTGTEAKPDGRNSVVFAPITLKGHERDLAITLTYSDETTGDIIESDIVINSAFPYELLKDGSQTEHPRDREHEDAVDDGHDQDEDDDQPSVTGDETVRVNALVRAEQRSSCVAQRVTASCGRDVYDVQNVVTHEVGHFFGLGEDMDDTSSTMYVCTNRCETHKRWLTTSDTSVLSTLYPEDWSEQSVAAGCALSRASAGVSAAGAFVAAFGALLFVARRRRRA